ncbi:MAG: HAD-IA family hydrolase [Rhodopila sp.]|nr:HAD-IA family hydrolase [Rhodopila sp.]
MAQTAPDHKGVKGQALSSTPVRIGLVIFDCDGVLIDSEALCDRVVSRELHRAGWPLSPEDCHRLFLGLTFPDIQQAAEAHLGRILGAGWVDRVIQRVTEVMAAEAEPIPGAREALQATTTLGLPFRIASNSSREEMAAKFSRAGLSDLVDGRIHSAYDLIAQGKRGKPDPDLFLQAAAAEDVPPAACLVIEDSLAGVRAAVAAGMTCLGFSPETGGAHLREAGALPFASMLALPKLLRTFLHGTQ